ncbi:MAG: hypothetical protein ACI8UC_000570, partial [Psychromonas sp.]
ELYHHWYSAQAKQLNPEKSLWLTSAGIFLFRLLMR